MHAREASADDAPSARGQELASLASCDLRDRFYSWRGASGQRYVCSIFRLDEESVVAEFSQAVVIGVVREGATRRPVCVLRSRDFETDDGRAVRDDARKLGVNEWHVRFGARDDIMLGLAAALLN
ncbi:MAG: hypothetical protein C3F11_07765 [Methylocystaceae bacterium]|nr:MAG: hypothetical protein C3F11_07765 [Methylocystaceae bacterium]